MSYDRVMTLREDPLVIATIHGPIEIHRIEGARDRKLRIVLPSGLGCRVGLDRALEHNAWLEIIDGHIAPKHPTYEASPDNAGGVILTPKKSQTTPLKQVEERPVIRVVRRACT